MYPPGKNQKGINKCNAVTDPAWVSMLKLKINKDCHYNDMTNKQWLFDRLVNVPSNVASNE